MDKKYVKEEYNSTKMIGGKVFEDSVASLIAQMVEDRNEQKHLPDAARGKSLSEQRRFREYQRAVMISKMDRENTALFRIRKECEKEKKSEAMRVCAQYTGVIHLTLEAEIRAEEEKEQRRLEAHIEFIKVTDKKSKAQEKTPCTNNECKSLTKSQKQATVFRMLSEGVALKKEQIEMEKQKEAQMEERNRHVQMDLELKLRQQEQTAKERNAATNKDMQAQWNTLLQQKEESKRLEKQRDLQLLKKQTEKEQSEGNVPYVEYVEQQIHQAAADNQIIIPLLAEKHEQEARVNRLYLHSGIEKCTKTQEPLVSNIPNCVPLRKNTEAPKLTPASQNSGHILEQPISPRTTRQRLLSRRASNSQDLPLIVPTNRVVLKGPPKVTKEKLVLPRIEPKTAKPITVTEFVRFPLSDRLPAVVPKETPVYMPQVNLKCTERPSSKYTAKVSYNLSHKFRTANNTLKLQQDLKAFHYKPSPPPKAPKTSYRTE